MLTCSNVCQSSLFVVTPLYFHCCIIDGTSTTFMLVLVLVADFMVGIAGHPAYCSLRQSQPISSGKNAAKILWGKRQ